MNEIRIIGIKVLDRIKEAGKTQLLLSKYAPIIRTRLGFHEVNSATCSRTGLIIIELSGNETVWDKFESDLKEIGGIITDRMVFKL